MDKKISVIVPVYKSEKYLNKCIESIINQTYKNLEIILVDDGSPDNCPQMCDDWAKKDSRIVVIHKQNGGVSSARNAGIDASTGDYVTFVDADDFVDANMLEVLTDSIGDADMAVCGFTFEYLDGRESCQVGCVEATYHQPLKSYIEDSIRPEACGKLIKKDAVCDIRFDDRFGYGEDLFFNYWVIKNCSKVVAISKSPYHYLQDSGNSSTTAIITDARAQSYKVFHIIAKDCKGDSSLYPVAVSRFTVGTFAILTRVMMVKEFEQKYFDEITNAILGYKSDIFKSKNLHTKYKISVFLMALSKGLFKKLYKLIGR